MGLPTVTFFVTKKSISLPFNIHAVLGDLKMLPPRTIGVTEEHTPTMALGVNGLIY